MVDEEIYRRLPTLLIATVDKFAQMPWNGKVQMLFGQVEGYCSRHGFRSPEIEDADTHPKKDKYPPAKTTAHPLLRPPDLIIQDELHLISGPLGTLVGLYETAVDKLCSWEVERQDRPAQADRLHGDDPQGRGPDPRHVPAGGPRLPAQRARRAGQLLRPPAAPERGHARSPLHRHLRPRPQAQGRPDPGLRRPAVRGPVPLREEGLRQGGGPVDDPDRLLQLDAGTGRDAAAGR